MGIEKRTKKITKTSVVIKCETIKNSTIRESNCTK